MKGASVRNVSRRFAKVWHRNWVVYQKTWKISFLPPMLEPLFYLAAFGLGLSSLVGNVRYRGAPVPYMDYIAPGLIAISAMNNAFFETTYASFVRMYYQKTFQAMLATPLSLEDIIVGEIVWGATKACIATATMMVVLSLFGFIHYPQGLLLLPLAFVGGLAFGSIGMFFTGIVPSIEVFNLPIFLFITPMFLFSGTFFPLANLPLWAQQLALAFPLTHLVNLSRAVSFGVLDRELLYAFGYLLLMAAVFLPLGISRMHRRLVK